jgi:hypothetical protein
MLDAAMVRVIADASADGMVGTEERVEMVVEPQAPATESAMAQVIAALTGAGLRGTSTSVTANPSRLGAALVVLFPVATTSERGP